MKKITLLILLLIHVISSTNAALVNSSTAQLVATNYYQKLTQSSVPQALLIFTETDSNNEPVYYAFNMNVGGKPGFVIVAADDAARPVIGYSTKGYFTAPTGPTPVAHWLNKCKREIISIRLNNYPATNDITTEWMDYQDSQKALNPFNNTASVSALVQTTWSQSPYYNALCPGGSVTGCVATAMSQIMRYWNYPANGTGSSSYCDCTSGGFSQNYGVLSANYGATTYNWSNMPLNVSSNNNDVATIMYQCGVSVNMDYSPSGSGAYVISSDNPICAQNSYVAYFGYDPNTIQGLEKSGYTNTQWINLLKGDLDIGRPIQYAGYGSDGGHTWVCDGYDSNNNFHMNWGWAGQDDGYFALTGLNPSSMDFTSGQQALIGIQPITGNAIDAGINTINSPSGSAFCTTSITPVIKLKNFGSALLTSCTINYQLDNGAIHTFPWTGSLPNNQITSVALPLMPVTSGAHTLTCFTSNPNSNTDGDGSNDQSVTTFTISAGTAPATVDASSCGTSSLTLNASGNGNLNWYTTPTGGSPIATGTSFTTPLINTTTMYYVESVIPGITANVGPATTTAFGGGGYHNNSSTQYLIFDVLQPCTIQTALVNSGAAGTRNIMIWDTLGTLLQTVPVNFPNGTGTVNLNIPLSPGSYRIGGTGMNLWRNNTGGSYPFNLSGTINITGSSAGPDYYYYLYNWQIHTDSCVSPRTPVSAIIGTQTVTYNNASYDTLDVNDFAVLLTGESPAGGTYSGTGVNNGIFDPSVAGPGTYTITYTYTNGNCTNSSTQTIYVYSTTGISSLDANTALKLYPNPSSGSFTVDVMMANSDRGSVQLVNTIGQTILNELHDFNAGQNKLNYQLGELAQGLYYIQVKTSTNVYTRSIVIK